MNYGKYIATAKKIHETPQIFSADSLDDCFQWAKKLIKAGWNVSFEKPTVMKQKPDGSFEEVKENEEVKEKSKYRFNCVDGFDSDGICLYAEFRDASEFSLREERFRAAYDAGNERMMSMATFKRYCEAPFPFSTSWEYYYYEGSQFEPFIYVAYDVDRNIHYFWS
jgi:hypothetical protein